MIRPMSHSRSVLGIRGVKNRADRSIDANEISLFNDLSLQWMDENGPFKALHSLNKLRLPWILKNTKNVDRAKLADVGCGGGLLSLPLARSGFCVTGIDASPEAIYAAQGMSSASIFVKAGISHNLSYQNTSVESLASRSPGVFDVVVASEIVEHVADVNSFISACCELAKPGAELFFTTINRTLLSRLFAVWLAEDVIKIVPKGVHDWEKFVQPDHLSQLLHDNGCRVKAINGFTYNPLLNRWSWIGSSSVNYALHAEKCQ